MFRSFRYSDVQLGTPFSSLVGEIKIGKTPKKKRKDKITAIHSFNLADENYCSLLCLLDLFVNNL